jgi:hypothetical protein
VAYDFEMKLSESQVWRIIGWTAVGFGFLIAIVFALGRDKEKPARPAPIIAVGPSAADQAIVAEARRKEAALHDEVARMEHGATGDGALRQQYLAKLSTSSYTLTVGGDGTAVVVAATPCNDAILGIFETDLGEKLKVFGFHWLVCADQGSRRRL